ncbi:MAG: ABC transporter permease [Acidobacteriota bacterium]
MNNVEPKVSEEGNKLKLISASKTRLSTGFPLLIACLVLILMRWKSFLSGWKFGSLDQFAASFYLTLLLFYLMLLLLGRANIPGAGRIGQEKTAKILQAIKGNRLSTLSLIFLFVVFSTAILAPILSPHDPNAQPDTLTLRYLPPLSHVWIISTTGNTEIYSNEIREREDKIEFRRGDRWETILKRDIACHKERWARERYFFLGTDKFGRDILSRIIYGSRISLAVGLLAVIIAATFGSLIGSLSGFFGSAVDSILMRTVDIMLAFPRIFLILMVVALFKPSLVLTIAVLAATGWMGVSRLVRGQTLFLRETDFVKAAQAMGQRSGRIILRHLIPNASAVIIVDSTLRIGNTILVEASLSFLGLGVPPPTPSWGSIISDGRDALLDAWWISTFPGIAILLTVVSFNLLGDSIREGFSSRKTQ